MSSGYRAVQWSPGKRRYDLAVVSVLGLYTYRCDAKGENCQQFYFSREQFIQTDPDVAWCGVFPIDDATYRVRLAELLLLLGRRADARAAAVDARRLEPKKAEALLLISEASSTDAEMDQALEWLEGLL